MVSLNNSSSGSLSNNHHNTADAAIDDQQKLVRRRSDKFQKYVAAKMHTMSNETVKESYSRQLERNTSPKLHKDRSSGSLGTAMSHANIFVQGEYGNNDEE